MAIFHTIVRFVHLGSVAVWFGSMVFFSFFAAPSIFKVLERETAGEVVGDIFPKYWLVGYVCSVLALGSLLLLSWFDRRYPTARIVVLALMLVITFYSGLAVGTKARALKAEIKAASDDSAKTALRAEFRRTHAVSAALNLSVIILGAVFIFLTAATSRDGSPQ